MLSGGLKKNQLFTIMPDIHFAGSEPKTYCNVQKACEMGNILLVSNELSND